MGFGENTSSASSGIIVLLGEHIKRYGTSAETRLPSAIWRKSSTVCNMEKVICHLQYGESRPPSAIWRKSSTVCNMEKVVCHLQYGESRLPSAIWRKSSAICKMEKVVCHLQYGEPSHESWQGKRLQR